MVSKTVSNKQNNKQEQSPTKLETKPSVFSGVSIFKRPSVFSKGTGFGNQAKPTFKFNPSQFKTQHKGGS